MAPGWSMRSTGNGHEWAQAMTALGPLGTAAAVARPAGRATKRLIGVVGLVVLLCLLCVGGATLSLLGGLTNPAPTEITGCGSSAAVNPNGQLPAVSGLTDPQIRLAAVIIEVGQELKVPARGWVSGVATPLQESRLTTLPFLGANNDHDSL